MRFGGRIVSYKTVLIAARGLSVDSLRSPQRVDGRHRATPVDGITLSSGEGHRERARSRRYALPPLSDGQAVVTRRSGRSALSGAR
jgi:hypothetical protein